jgi:hypothetical protein
MSSEGKGINSIATMHGGMRVVDRKRETWDMEGDCEKNLLEVEDGEEFWGLERSLRQMNFEVFWSMVFQWLFW